jgi:hypothetical protein
MRAQMQDTDLTDTNMEDSTLVETDFSNANLEGADMDGCDVRRAVWAGAKNLNPQKALSLGTSETGKPCTHAKFALPQRKVKSGLSGSRLATKHLGSMFKSISGGGESDDSGSNSHDESDSASEAGEGEDEDEDVEGKSWVENIVAAVGEAGSHMQRKLEEAQGSLGEEFDKICMKTGGPLTLQSLQKKLGAPQSPAAQQAVPVASFTSHCEDVLYKALRELGSKLLQKLAESLEDHSALESVPPEGQGVEAVKKALVSGVQMLCGEAVKQLTSKTVESGLAAAFETCIQSLAVKKAPEIAASVGKAQAQASDIESALERELKSELDRVRHIFETDFFDNCISRVVRAEVQVQVQARLGKFAGGLAKKIKLIGMYEGQAAKIIKEQENTAKKHTGKLFGADKLREQVS